MARGCPYGSHRVLEPAGVLPQAAWRLDNSPAIADNELRIDVSTLHVDAASFRQLYEQAGGDPDRIGALILDIVGQRGKLHNPVTGSGGMLTGTVAAVGPDLAARPGTPAPGTPVATLVSLTLTPLHIEAIEAVRPRAHQVDVRGHAILFETGLLAPLPPDLPRSVALAVLDVAGAPAQAWRLAQPGMTVLVLGAGGKSGLLCAAAVRRKMGAQGMVVAVDASPAALADARRLGAADLYVLADATRPLDLLAAVRAATGGRLADLTLVCVSSPGAEMGAILTTAPTGTIYFFSMATSFTAAALGAEGVGSPVQMIIGNGYTPGHAAMALQLVRESPVLQQIFLGRYGSAIPSAERGEV